MPAPQAPTETAGNALRALQGQSLEVNTPFEQVGRLAEAIQDGGGGGGGSYDDTEIKNRLAAVEKATFIAQYQQTTAQDIVAFLNNNPHAALLVKNGDDVYTTIFSKKLADNKVLLRTIASLQSKFNIFEYTVENGSWRATTTPLYYDDTELALLIAQNKRNIARIAEFLGIDLTYEYLPLAQNQGVIFEDGLGIDTGLTLDGRATFTFTGCLKDDQKQVCVIGARTGTSTTERTCVNVLPVSGQVQSQWAANAYKVLKDDMDFLTPFEVYSNSDSTYITQNGVEITAIQNSGFAGTNTETPICLFNQALDNEQYYSPVLQRAEIEIDGIKTVFEPKIKRNTITGEESIVLLKNGVDMNISGLTLFEIQAA